jgi:RNA ligase
MEFKPFSKIPRWSKQLAIVTEKIDGTNASIYIGPNGEMLVGSRNRWITPEQDNYGFAAWAYEHKSELLMLGPGHHFGEWWGLGIQRNYGLKEKRFSVFNTMRWGANNVLPTCYQPAPVLKQVMLKDLNVDEVMENLKSTGSIAAPGFMKPEGIIIYLPHTDVLFKKTFEKDEGKG